MTTDISLQGFVKNVSETSCAGKELLHYKSTQTMINMYNGLVAFKNVSKGENVIIPNAKVDSNNKISFEFAGSDITDLSQFSNCIKKNFVGKQPHIRENTKTIVVKV